MGKTGKRGEGEDEEEKRRSARGRAPRPRNPVELESSLLKWQRKRWCEEGEGFSFEKPPSFPSGVSAKE